MNAVAPLAGIRPRFARFSIPNRLAPSSVRCAENCVALPGSRLSVSTPMPAIARSSISHSTASPLNPGKCETPEASALRYAASLPPRASQPEFIATTEPRLIRPWPRS